MMYWNAADTVQGTSIFRPAVTPTDTDPQIVYEFTSIETPAAGKESRNPIWKLFKPFTTAMQPERL